MYFVCSDIFPTLSDSAIATLTLRRALSYFAVGQLVCFDANLGPQPRGLARSYRSSQQPTAIVCLFVYGEICHSNPLCGGK